MNRVGIRLEWSSGKGAAKVSSRGPRRRMIVERSPTPSPPFSSELSRRSSYPRCDLGPVCTEQFFFFLFLDDDARRHHQHEAVGRAAKADVLEEAVDIRHLREDWHAEFVATFAESLDAAQEHRAAVGHADSGGDGGEEKLRQLDRRACRLQNLLVGIFFLTDTQAVEGGSALVACEPRLLVAALGRCGSRALKLKLLNIPDRREEGHKSQPDKPAVAGNNSLHVDGRSLREHGDDRLLSGCKVAYNRHHARHKRSLPGVGNIRALAVEECHFGRLHDIRSRVTLRSLNEKVGLDVGEDRKAKVGGRCGRVG